MWKFLMGLGLIAAPGFVFAAGMSDMDYVVAGGFSTYVNAFTRLKYIFSDNQFAGMVVSIVLVSIPIGMMAMVGRATVQGFSTGKPSLNFGWLGMWLLGSVVFRGVMLPTSTIHIYDQDRNLYQPVSGVPSVMVMAAGFTNKFTQLFHDVIIRNSASTTRSFGEGAPIKMLSALVTGEGAPFDPYLKRNITEFWHSCADVASQTNSTTFDRAKVLTGSNRLLADLAPLANPAVYTEWYSKSSPYNSTVSCTDAYTKIKTAMSVTGAAGTGPFGERIKSVCEKTGFSSTNAGQLADCATRMEQAVQDIFGDSGLTLTIATQNIMLAQAINDSLLQENPNAAIKQLVNRSMVNAGIADATGSPEWISEIKAGVVAVVLAMMPILAMLAATPLLSKVAPLILGLWIFIAAWDIADLMLLQAANDQIYTVLDELRRSNMGLDMLTLAPTASMKALSVLAASREHAMSIAVFIAGLFGVSAYSMQSLGSRVTANLDKANDKAADQALTTEGRGALLSGMTQGVAAETAHGAVQNISSMANPQALGQITEASRTAAVTSAYGGVAPAGKQIGQMTGATEVGQHMGTGTSAAALATSTTSAERQVGEASGVTQAASANGQTVSKMAQSNSAVATSAEVGRNEALLESGQNLAGISGQSREITSDQTVTSLGSSRGRTAAAADLGIDKQELAKRTTHSSAAYQGADAQRQQESAANSGGWDNLVNIDSAAQEASRDKFKDNPNGAQAYQRQLLDEGVAKSEGRQDVYSQTGGLDSVNHAQGVADAAHGAGVAETLATTPQATQGLIADSANKTAQQVGSGNTLGTQAVTQGTRSGQIRANEEMAANHVYDMFKAAGLSDRAIAQSKANNHVPLSVNPEQARALNKSGLISDKQLDAIQQNGSGSVLFDLAQDQKGHILANTHVSAGNSTAIDNSWKSDASTTQDNSRTVRNDDIESSTVERNTAAFTGNPDSDRRYLSDKNSLLALIESKGLQEAGADYAQASSSVLAGVMREEVIRSNTANAGVSGWFGKGGKNGGASIDAGMKAETADQSIVNTQRVKMQAAFDNIVEEGRGKHKLEGNDLNVFVASKAANVFERAYDNSAGYADKHQGTNSPLEPLAAVPQPEKKEDIAPGMSSHYGPGATFDQMKKPNLDPAYKAATDSALHDVKTMRNSVQATDGQQSQLKPSVVAELPESLANPGEQSQQLEQRGNLQPEALASTGRPGEQSQQPDTLANKKNEDADHSATNSNAKVDHVSSLIGSGKFNEDTRPALEENLAHAQNSLEQVAQERGLDNHWVNANLRRYTEAVQTAPRGNENQAAIDELSSAGVTTNNGSMPPIPQGKNNPQGGVMPPVEYQKYKDGVDGF